MNLDELIQAAMNEIGVPQPGYPAPVANAYEHLEAARAIIAKGRIRSEPTEPPRANRYGVIHNDQPIKWRRFLVIPLDEEAPDE